MAEQRRGRKIAMTGEELDAFLSEERTCRVATIGSGGRPHNTPLWYAWDGTALWLYSIVKSQRWVDLQRDPRVSVMVDAGHDFSELRGAELLGEVSAVGEVPRTGEDGSAELRQAEALFANKYQGSPEMTHDGRHAWVRLEPETVVSWDFRKMGLPSA
jgi:nitroimidazol reductase NimA-like FMN-containing flavoprotein (pyridoxamine 5'-phosphate oxidase superfamily)